MALTHAGDPGLAPVIDRARAYMRDCQVDATGGFGYSKGASKADLSNTAVALEALRASGVAKEDPVFKNVQRFLDSCHNDSESNKAAWATADGGFVYRPGESKAGSYRDASGVERHRSYGLMSYAGLLSFLTAYVERDDPRVASAWRWVSENWDLDSNRNLGQKGLYYYYLTMTKALAAHGERVVTTKEGVKHEWPRELAEAIIARQRVDGSWQNEEPTWYEGDPVLVTAYMIRALSVCWENRAGQAASEAR
jgi:squalene-hopene/tetraprenyl-beta-curcumene cyclase